MTTITIHDEGLRIGRDSFRDLSDLIAYLEEHGLVATLHELSNEEVTDDIRLHAEDARKQYRVDDHQ